jgi:uncharacterized membrane protein
MTYMRRDHISEVPHRYSEAFNGRAVAEVESGQYTAPQAAATHVVNFASVYKWQTDFLMLGLGVLAAMPTVGALVYSVLAWKNNYWDIVARVYHMVVTVAAVAFVRFLNCSNLVGWRFSLANALGLPGISSPRQPVFGE